MAFVRSPAAKKIFGRVDQLHAYSRTFYSTLPIAEIKDNENDYDLAIVGGGIVGAATAYRISQMDRQKPLRIVILEKEKELAMHQTGRNSGVIHSGIYYRPGECSGKISSLPNCNQEICSNF
jgi:FAD dependent oxidoreductase